MPGSIGVGHSTHDNLVQRCGFRQLPQLAQRIGVHQPSAKREPHLAMRGRRHRADNPAAHPLGLGEPAECREDCGMGDADRHDFVIAQVRRRRGFRHLTALRLSLREPAKVP